MLHLVKLDRSCSPETIAVMTAAFDKMHAQTSQPRGGIGNGAGCPMLRTRLLHHDVRRLQCRIAPTPSHWR